MLALFVTWIDEQLCKFPDIEDFERCIYETDEKEFMNLRISCVDLRSNYAIIFDMITKNMEKLRKPRGENHALHMF